MRKFYGGKKTRNFQTTAQRELSTNRRKNSANLVTLTISAAADFLDMIYSKSKRAAALKRLTSNRACTMNVRMYRLQFSLVMPKVARFFLIQTYQNGKNIPNDHKLYQTAINYTNWQ
jgi:hypothetical protein